MNVSYFAYLIADIWMNEPVHIHNVGHARIEPELLDIFEDSPSVDDLISELEQQAVSRGYDYTFHHYEDNAAWVIEWRNNQLTPTLTGE